MTREKRRRLATQRARKRLRSEVRRIDRQMRRLTGGQIYELMLRSLRGLPQW